jgi:hypothetical protein
MIVIHLDLLAPALRREWLENGHLRRNRATRRCHKLETSERKNRRCTVRLFRTNSIKEGAM